MRDPVLLQAVDVTCRYPGRAQGRPALDRLSLTLARGEWVAVAGPNGSGKSTLARVLAGLIPYQEGELWLNGQRLTPQAYDVRTRVGLVFQDPASQVVGATVEEDVAFGPENLGLPPSEIRRRVEEALALVGLAAMRHRPTRSLSGGQRQRLAMAGALAMEPDLLILDEPTAMLDPRGQEEVLAAVRRLNRCKKTAVLWITHRLEETLLAHRLLILQRGQVVAAGPPAPLLAGRQGPVESWGLRPPEVIRLAGALRRQGLPVPEEAATLQALTETVLQAWRAGGMGR